jgi:hypothetical protein
MMTVRHIEKLWNAQNYERLMRDMLAGRPEASVRLAVELPAGAIPAAALALMRLDELSQSHVPLYSKLLRIMLAAQDQDGGWSDPLTTALCLRALLAGRGDGAAVERGLFYLAQLQKPEGIWPKVPIRRMPADPFVSAFILLQLGADQRFRSAVRFMDALNWFEDNEATLDPETRKLWDYAFIRCAVRRHDAMQTMLSWS